MKKLFFVMAAVAALLTSCSKDDTFGGPTRGKVTFEVSTPELATRVYGDGTTAKNLYYAVYDVIENAMVKTNYDTTDTTDGVTFGSDLKATVTIDLVEGRPYEVAFWAESANSPYIFNAEAKTVSYNPNTSLTANNENYDAFFAYVPKEQVKVGQVVGVDLKRPFAQLNVATSDAETAKELGVEVKATGIKVDAYTSFNLQTGAVSDKEELTFAMTNVDNVATTEKEYNIGTITANSKDYDWLTMNYILVNERETTDVTFLFEDTNDKADYERPYSSINVQRNHRTNIIGAILTDPTQFDVTIDKVFTTPDINEERGNSRLVSNAQSLQEAINDPDVDVIVFDGHIDLNDLTSTTIYDNSAALSTTTRAGETSYGLLIPAGKTLTLDLNGFTISQVKAQTGNYSMIQNDGNLTIMDSSTTGAGKLSYKDSGNGGEYISNTITNRGTLTVKSGRIENVSSETTANTGYCYAIDTSIWGEAEEVVVNIEGGEVASIYSPLRVRADSQTEQVTANISGGKIYGRIDHQMSSSKAGVLGALNISGGEFYKQGITDANLMIFGAGVDTDASGITASITGGTFDAPIVIYRGEYVPLGKNFNEHFISGGTFSDASVFKYLSDSAEEINITMAADMEVPITSFGSETGGSGEYKLGGENTKKITIDLNSHKLNITTTYWSAIGAKNNDALITIKNGKMTSTGNSAGTWDAWDLRFSNCNYAFEDVEFEKAVALDNVGKSTSMKNVTITDTHDTDTYGLWITAEGQTVTLEDCVIDMIPASDGRGIKIDEQYVNAPAKVTLNVKGVTFKTEEKAAILVKSVAGAEINASNLNIEGVAADKVFAVWVDEDAAAHADKVVVNGALVRVEGEIPTEITTDSAEAMAGAIAAGVPNINLTGNVTYDTDIIKDATIDLGGNTFEATGTIELGNNADLTMTGGDYEVNGTYGHIDVRPSSAEGSELLFEGVDFSFNKMGPTYGPSTNRLGSVVEVCATAANAHTKIKFKDCTFDNAQVLFEGMSGKTGTFEAVFENCTFNALTSSAPVYVQNYVEGTITMTGCTFNLECTSSTASAISISSSSSTKVTLNASNNTLNAVAATPYTYDASQGETEVHNVKVNGTPNNIKFVSAYSNTTLNVTGTTVTGIAVNE